MKETQVVITKTLAITTVGILFFFSLTFILLNFIEDYKTPKIDVLKDAWDVLGSFFGGITTLVAAYIATQLFNDWRVVKQYEIILNYILIIKKQIQELIIFINSNRNNFIKFRLKIKDPHLKLEEFQSLQLEIAELESEIVAKLNLIFLEMNELYYLKTKKEQDPIAAELIEKIKYLSEIGVNQNNYFNVWEKRLTTTVLDEYFYYITDDLTVFVYDRIITKYLDDLILDVN